jgi:DNA-binding beta-propeller fold protein YncE
VSDRHDVTAPKVPDQLDAHVNESTRRDLTDLGRTEDLALDPSGRRLAIAAFELDVLGIVDIEIVRPAGSIRFGDVREVEAEGLERPHGLVFVDDTTLLVANREAELVVVELCDDTGAAARSTVVLDDQTLPPVRSPGSLTAQWIADDLLEVIVCNNYAHDVTRHVLDRRRGWSAVDGEVLLRRGLSVPDGIAVEPYGAWIAVSNHLRNQVYLYRYDEDLGPDSDPAGVLSGANFAHGLAFTPDGRHLVVADAGLPYLLAYTAEDGDWSGDRGPTRITRVMDDETFNRGRYNPQEGGPKGVVITPTGAVIVTSEFQTGCFDLDDVIGAGVAGVRGVRGEGAGAVAAPNTRWRQVAHARSERHRAAGSPSPARRVRQFAVRSATTGVRRSGHRLLRALPVRAREQAMHAAEEVADIIRTDAL